MLTEERQIKILNIVNERRSVSLVELMKNIDASESTLRRDLTELDSKGLLRKVRGGATQVKADFSLYEANVSQKIRKNMEEKRIIARYTANLINNDDMIYIDAGTTTERLIDEIVGNLKTIFVTNGINHAKKLIKKGLKTYMIGGQMKATTEAVIGAGAVRELQYYNFTKCFMGINGIAVDAGFTTPDPEEAIVKSEAIKRSYVTYFLADWSKFNKVYACTVADLQSSCIVTDHLPDNKFKEITVVKEVCK